ncbi:MAG: nucleotidyl transferase AbiEii/AbiGii toxin family protein [Zoogloeaceae bacterium]|nr:nucleotidyl transferase AbiEii/AbiGii toxin family protein [Zoogloeaceae bacterium]
MLKLDSLPDATRRVFDHLAANTLLREFTLIGGSALALQFGHRHSEDLDFWIPAERMDKESISEVVRIAQQAGFEAALTTPHQHIIFEKINGRDLLAHAQDYVIGGVKVTFFARTDGAYRHFDSFPRIDNSTSFCIMGEEGLFAMKAHVIHQRVRSRDLHDLKMFLERGKRLGDIFQAASAADPACSEEYAKAVLIGEVPLDKEDEGFASIGVTESMEGIHAFFKDIVDAYEQAVAEETRMDEDETPRP